MLESLNDAQRDAVTHEDGPLVILAGAGSGKTRVITHRIAHLIERGDVAPDAIAALTFTNRAADEMRTRVHDLLAHSDERDASAADEVVLSTFHSLGARLLRRHGHQLGLDRDFSILDQRDQTDLLRDVLEATGRDVDRQQRRAWQRSIERAKHRAMTPAETRAEAATDEELARAAVYADYQKRARARNCADFGDLLLGGLELFREDESLARHYSQQWQYVMVDEFQDTNPAQYEWLDHLTATHTNLAVVGDDDQSIYRWRGADVGHILEFESNYPDAEVVTLDRNYRSTQLILNAAHDVVQHNPKRRDKELWTSQKGGEPITCLVAETARGEAAFVTDEIRRLVDEGLDFSSVAVFYRTNDQSQRLEEQCRADDIPYQIRGNRSFYEYREIRDLLAYLRLALNPEDDVSALRVLGVPPRGIGDATVDKLRRATDVPGLDSLVDAVRWTADVDASEDTNRRAPAPEPDAEIHRAALKALDSLRGRPAEGVEDFCQVLFETRDDLEQSGEDTLTEAVQHLVERLQYANYLEREHGSDAGGRKDRVRELMKAVRTFEDEYGDDEAEALSTLRAFLERSALTREDDHDTDGDAVTLTTIHGAKGLEFDTVFIVGLEEGLFPHVDESPDPAELREERRLAYVAITRAERKLYTTWALERRRRGEWSRQKPSRFLFEIDDARLEFHDRSRIDDFDAWVDEAASWADGWGRSHDDDAPETTRLTEKRADRDTLADDAPSEDDRAEAGLVGARVSHAKFGQGEVRKVTEAGGRTKLTIEFADGGEQTIVRRFVDVLEA